MDTDTGIGIEVETDTGREAGLIGETAGTETGVLCGDDQDPEAGVVKVEKARVMLTGVGRETTEEEHLRLCVGIFKLLLLTVDFEIL